MRRFPRVGRESHRSKRAVVVVVVGVVWGTGQVRVFACCRRERVLWGHNLGGRTLGRVAQVQKSEEALVLGGS